MAEKKAPEASLLPATAPMEGPPRPMPSDAIAAQATASQAVHWTPEQIEWLQDLVRQMVDQEWESRSHDLEAALMDRVEHALAQRDDQLLARARKEVYEERFVPMKAAQQATLPTLAPQVPRTRTQPPTMGVRNSLFDAQDDTGESLPDYDDVTAKREVPAFNAASCKNAWSYSQVVTMPRIVKIP